jgi:hypothetical protein
VTWAVRPLGRNLHNSHSFAVSQINLRTSLSSPAIITNTFNRRDAIFQSNKPERGPALRILSTNRARSDAASRPADGSELEVTNQHRRAGPQGTSPPPASSSIPKIFPGQSPGPLQPRNTQSYFLRRQSLIASETIVLLTGSPLQRLRDDLKTEMWGRRSEQGRGQR